MRQAFIGRRNYSVLLGLLFFEEKRDEKNDLRMPGADMLPEVCVPAYANRLPELIGIVVTKQESPILPINFNAACYILYAW